MDDLLDSFVWPPTDLLAKDFEVIIIIKMKALILLNTDRFFVNEILVQKWVRRPMYIRMMRRMWF